MGVTTVVPDMDASRPARCDPRRIVEAIHDWHVTQSFGSPAIWNRVGQYCQQHNVRLPTLRRVLAAGAPVPPHVLMRMKACIADHGEMFTPYGATEALPVASIGADEVQRETRHRWATGGGTCVGKKFSRIDWKVIQIVDGPLSELAQAVELPSGQIGELIVSGPVVTRQYATRNEWNALSKISDGQRFWHRMGDVGYLDNDGRFWFCGRMAHRVAHCRRPDVHGSLRGDLQPASRRVPLGTSGSGTSRRAAARHRGGTLARASAAGQGAREKLLGELAALAAANSLTVGIRDFLICRAMPVDVRHNAKIAREKLAVWAAGKLR